MSRIFLQVSELCTEGEEDVVHIVVGTGCCCVLNDDGRSTNLDSWQLNQLRTMKVGGNTSATDFFNKHGGSALLNDSDCKKKYSSRVAELYKEELARRVKEDTTR